ncbi:hypothetical protein BD408DRAFT_399619 [Parasitella parasitica]|nr:hypothetical protein BD408DRAFT_399619 [Parasitella parasitica]
MPQYCRYCQSSLDHCKADCAKLRNLMICHTCNEHGHLSKQCSRNNFPSNIHSKVVTVAEMKPRKSSKKPASSSTIKENSPTKPASSISNTTGTSSSPAPFVYQKNGVPASQPSRPTANDKGKQKATFTGPIFDTALPMQDTSIEKGDNTTLHLATLNSRSLVKLHNPSAISPFLRYLRHTDNDIFVVQETNLVNERQQDRLNTMFQAKSSTWTHYCGIVSVNPAEFVIISPPTLTGPDGRYILTSIKSTANASSPIAHILGIYAPAAPKLRCPLFAELAANSAIRNTLQQPEVPVFILGDFNYNISDNLPSHYNAWLWLLQGYFVDFLKESPLPTFLSTQGVRKWLDYIYCSDYYHSQVCFTNLEPVPYAWTDHSLLSVTVNIQGNGRGPGNWKANPF